MGIPKFYRRWFRRLAIPGLRTLAPPSRVAGLYLDLNGILHQGRAEITGEAIEDAVRRAARFAFIEAMPGKTRRRQLWEELAKYTFNEILRITSYVRPRLLLYIAVDGIAPTAKMNQQRNGRYLNARLGGNRYIDGNAIHPGTELMRFLSSKLQELISEHRQAGRQILPPAVIYSSHLTVGEGEHKIFDFLRQLVAAAGSPGEAESEAARTYLRLQAQDDNEGAHVIWGLDADLVVLSTVSRIPRLHLYREDLKDRNPNERRVFVSVDNFRTWLVQQQRIEPEDFSVVLSLLGNDFLPRQPSLLDIENVLPQLLREYRDLGVRLIAPRTAVRQRRVTDEIVEDVPGEDVDLDLQGLAALFHRLALMEATLLDTERRRAVYARSPVYELAVVDGVFDLITFRELWYNVELGRGEQPVTQERVDQMCVDYIQSMAWVLRYYVYGLPYTAFDLVYPHLYTPLFVDLARVAGSMAPPTLHRELEPIEVRAYHHMLAVLPYPSRNLLPTALRRLMGHVTRGRSRRIDPLQLPILWDVYTSPILDLFPHGHPIEWLVVESEVMLKAGLIVVLPPVDLPRIVDAVEEWQERSQAARGPPFELTPLIQQRMAPQLEVVDVPYRDVREWQARHLDYPQRVEQRMQEIRERQERGRARGRGRGRGRGVPSTSLVSSTPTTSLAAPSMPTTPISAPSTPTSTFASPGSRGSSRGEFRGSSSRGEFRGRGSRGPSSPRGGGRGSRGPSSPRGGGRGSRGPSSPRGSSQRGGPPR